MRIIVTGALGFIGSRVCSYFIEQGHMVNGWDLYGSQGIYKTKFVNMQEQSEIENEIITFKPDIIIHCAGSADVGKSIKAPFSDFNNNVSITHNLLFALHNVGMSSVRLIFLSSASVYGNPKKLPIKENSDLEPMSPYALHKVMCEELCRYFIRNYGMDIRIVRIFSAYGNELKKQIFWDMYQKALHTKRLDMFGTGLESRDYIHIEDVAQSIFLVATRPTKDYIFNVANGEETTICKATEIFAEYFGISKGNIAFNGVIREGEPLNWKADISKIIALGYKKTVNLNDGINAYIKHQKQML